MLLFSFASPQIMWITDADSTYLWPTYRYIPIPIIEMRQQFPLRSWLPRTIRISKTSKTTTLNTTSPLLFVTTLNSIRWSSPSIPYNTCYQSWSSTPLCQLSISFFYSTSRMSNSGDTCNHHAFSTNTLIKNPMHVSQYYTYTVRNHLSYA